MTIDIKALRALSEAATPGPWERSKYYRINVVAPAGQIVGRVNSDREVLRTDAVAEAFNSANMGLIIASRNALPELLDLVESQAAEIERLRGQTLLCSAHVDRIGFAEAELERHRALVADLRNLDDRYITAMLVGHGFGVDSKS